MTYNVFGGTLNLAQLAQLTLFCYSHFVLCCHCASCLHCAQSVVLWCFKCTVTLWLNCWLQVSVLCLCCVLNACVCVWIACKCTRRCHLFPQGIAAACCQQYRDTCSCLQNLHEERYSTSLMNKWLLLDLNHDIVVIINLLHITTVENSM